MTNCINCGQQIDKAATVCPFCGAVQEDRTILINQTQQQYTQQSEMGYNQQGFVPQQPQMGYNQQGFVPQQPQMGYAQQGFAPQQSQMGYAQQSFAPQQPQVGYAPQQYVQQPQYGQRPPKKPVNRKLIGVIACVVVVALLVTFVLIKLLGPGSLSMEGAVEAYFEAIVDRNAEDYVDACYSSKFLKACIDEYGMDRDDMMEYTEEMFDWYYDYIQDVRNIRIKDKDKFSKSEVKEINDEIEDETGVKLNFSEIVYVTVEYEYKEDGEWEEAEDYLTLYKSGMKWYVLD